MPREGATTERVDLVGLMAFIRPRHRMIAITARADGSRRHPR